MNNEKIGGHGVMQEPVRKFVFGSKTERTGK
jgi:hypothetical protein